MRKSLILIYFLLSILPTGFSQDRKIFHSAATLSHDFNILNHKTNHNICNHFLDEIARGYAVNVEDITFSIRYTRIIDIYRIYQEEAIVEVTYKPIDITGDVFFRDFDISQYLHPVRVELVLDYSHNGNDPTRRVHFEDVPIDGSTVSKRVSLSSDKTKLSAQVKGQSFLYSHVELNSFDDRIALIDDYSSSSAILDTALNILYTIDLQEGDNQINTFLNLLETGNIISHLEVKDLNKSLDLGNYDPLGYQRTLTILKYRHSSMLDDFVENLETMEVYTGNMGIREIVGQYVTHYTKYFELSNELNFYSGSTYWPLGQVIINNQALANYKLGLDQLVSMADPVNKPGSLIYAFAKHLYNEWIKLALNYLDEERYAEATNILGNAKDMCDHLASIQCTSDLFHYTSRAKLGIFDSYMRIAEKGLLAYHPDIAGNYLVKAYNFQEKNKAYIISNQKVKNMLNKLMETYFHQIDIDLNSGYYEDALTKLERVQHFDQEYFNLIYVEKIGKRKEIAQQGYYEKMLADAIIYLELNNLPGAQHQLYEAINYQALYAEQIEPSYITDSIELVLHQNEAYLFEEAELATAPIPQEYSQAVPIKPYKKRVKPKRPSSSTQTDCHKYQLAYYTLYLETKKSLEEEHYIQGGDLLDKLRKYNTDDTSCFLQKKDLTKISANYQPLIDYSRRIRDLERIIQEKSYDLILGLISDLDAQYKLIESKELEIDEVNFTEMCISSGDIDLNVFAANFFISNKEFLKSFKLIENLKDMSLDESMAEPLQIATAEGLSVSDYIKDPGIDPKKQVEKYTKGDKWFNPFKKAYIKNWGNKAD